MIDLNDMSTLSLSDLIPDQKMDNKRLDLVLRALEQKLLKIPERIKRANKGVDFGSGRNEEIMIDIDDMTTEMYELVSCVREFIPISGCVSDWISVADRLPEEDGKYLIITPDGYIKLIQYYEHHGGTFFGGVIATHWMPLPKPPTQ
jgi:hypothetical protein